MRGTNLAQTGREYYDFVNFTHLFQKIVYPWALNNVYIVPVIFDFNRYDVVGLLNRLEKGQNR